MSRDFGRLASGIAGAAIGGPWGAAITVAGGLLFQQKPPTLQSGRIPDYQQLLTETSAYGAPIMEFFGSMQTTGNIIDCRYVGGVAAGIEEVISSSGGGHQFTGSHGSSSSSQPTDTYTYFLTAAYAFGRAPLNQPLYVDQLWIQDSAGKHVIWDITGASDAAKGFALTPQHDANGVEVGLVGTGLHIWYGLDTQPVDSILESFHGAGNVPAYCGVCYVVLDRFQLRYGYGMLGAIVRNAVTGKSDMVTTLLTRAGVPSRRVNLTQLMGTIDGMALGPGASRQYVENICTIGLCNLAPIDGLIVDRSRANPLYQSIDRRWMGAHVVTGKEDANSLPEPLTVGRVELKTLPSQVKISFQDTNLRYNNNDADYYIENAAQENVVTVDLGAIAGNLTDMTRLAAVLGDEMWMANQTYSFDLMPSCSRLAPGDVAYLLDETGDVPQIVQALVTEQELTPDGILQCKGTRYDGGVYGQFVTPDQTILPPDSITLYDPPTALVIQPPALNDVMAATPGVLVAACCPAGWTGAQLQSAVLGTVDIPKQATMGTLLTAYNYTDADTVAYNYSTTIRVRLSNGALVAAASESVVTETQANVLLIAHPTSGLVSVIQFVDCAQVNATDYDLTGLLPGRAASDYVTSLPIGSGVVAMTDENANIDNAPIWVPLGISSIGKSASYSVVPNGPASAASTPANVVIAGNSVKTLEPVYVRADRSVSGETTLLWNPRTRYETGANASMTRLSDPLDFAVQIAGCPETIVRNSTQVTFPDSYFNSYLGAVPATLSGTITGINGLTGRGFTRSFSNV